MRSLIRFALFASLLSPASAQRVVPAACVYESYSSLKLLPTPESANPIAVILGSSTAAGVGAVAPASAWAAELSRRLAPRGINVLNQSVPGSSTADSLERFERDVASQQPAFVLLTTSIVNEKVLIDPPGALERYQANTAKLIERTRQIGAVPALMTMYPHNRYTANETELIARWTQAAEATGWPLFNFMSPLSDSAGKWLRGLTEDGVHPLDPGHEQMAESIPDSLLSVLLDKERHWPESNVHASWRSAKEGERARALLIRFDRPLSSWTVAAFIRDPAVEETSVYFETEGDRSLRLTREGHALQLSVDESLKWTGVAPAESWSHLALTYQSLTGRTIVVVDGLAVGEVRLPTGVVSRTIGVAGNCRACNVAHLLAYRSNLHEPELATLAGKAIHRRSLDLRVPMNIDARENGTANLAQTMTLLEVDEGWLLDMDQFPPDCPQVRDPRESTGEGNR